MIELDLKHSCSIIYNVSIFFPLLFFWFVTKTDFSVLQLTYLWIQYWIKQELILQQALKRIKLVKKLYLKRSILGCQYNVDGYLFLTS